MMMRNPFSKMLMNRFSSPRPRVAIGRAMFRMLLLAAGFAASALTAGAQKPDVHVKWYHVGEDSLQVEYALPATGDARPNIIILPDRFGSQHAVTSIVSIFARQGFRAFAIPLRSAPSRDVHGIPPAAVDSADADVLAEIVIDILNEPRSSGKAGLFAFDVGATAGLLAATRLPLFKSLVLFYPFDAAFLQRALPEVPAPVLLNIAEYDADCSMAKLAELRERMIEAGRKMTVAVHKTGRPFFFNPKHEHFDKRLTNRAWTDAIRFFRSTL